MPTPGPAAGPGGDPVVPDWEALELPPSWVDALDLRRVRDLWRLLRLVFGKRRPVVLPDDLPGRDRIPAYALQEFHNLPNGNYSNGLSRGYITGFDKSMLGTTHTARARLARELAGAGSALDVGCAGGETAAALGQAGIEDVWGLDPSPYLLKHAARAVPDVNFVQGSAEHTGFPDGRFDALACCFLFHELPPRYAHEALDEFHRILRPGGRLAISEPAPEQMSGTNSFRLLLKYGPKGPWFRWLARFVNEPFVAAWHGLDQPRWLDEHGFELLTLEDEYPFRYIVARRR